MPKGVHLAKVTITCAECKKRFECVASDLNRKYCSKTCYRAGPRKATLYYKTCVECDVSFQTKSWSRKLCSTRCRGILRARIFHGLAKGELRKYQKRELLKNKGKCERCNWAEVPGVLELHHKDRNTKNNNLDNLTLLCPNCHSIDHFIAKDGQFKHNLGRRSKNNASQQKGYRDIELNA